MSDRGQCFGHLFYASGVIVWRCQHTKEHVSHPRLPTAGQECEACRRPLKIHSRDPGRGLLDLEQGRVYMATAQRWEPLRWFSR